MAKYVRYALATVCVTASVGCLALWWRSMTRYDLLTGPCPVSPRRQMTIDSMVGTIGVCVWPEDLTSQYRTKESSHWRHDESPNETAMRRLHQRRYGGEHFGLDGDVIHLPLWYPAVVFALAGVAVLRFRRQFSIRSVLVATTVVAALIGIAVAL